MTETEHRLFLWFPMWAGRLLLLCYTKIPSSREDLARHAGCRCKNLSLYLGLRMGFEAQDKRNWGKKDATKEYLKLEESIRAK
jgi:hypothetical protein